MRNIALKLMYVGTAYHGWQVQKNGVTVQETLQNALATVVCHPVKCTGAGRTDAGVHAEVYIANFRTTSTIPVDRLPLAVNTRLPEDIVVVSAREVSEGFNAIGSCVKKEYTYRVYNSRIGILLFHTGADGIEALGSCVKKEYTYRVYNSRIRNAFYVNRAYFYPKHLDEAVMAEAARRFVGTHDFAAVRAVGTNVKSTVRTVYYFDVARKGDLIELKVCANGFLYNMVRAMTGTVLYAAEGKLTPDGISDILERGNRTEAGPTVPPGGLYMTKLWYNEPVGLDTDPQ